MKVELRTLDGLRKVEDWKPEATLPEKIVRELSRFAKRTYVLDQDSLLMFQGRVRIPIYLEVSVSSGHMVMGLADEAGRVPLKGV